MSIGRLQEVRSMENYKAIRSKHGCGCLWEVLYYYMLWSEILWCCRVVFGNEKLPHMEVWQYNFRKSMEVQILWLNHIESVKDPTMFFFNLLGA